MAGCPNVVPPVLLTWPFAGSSRGPQSSAVEKKDTSCTHVLLDSSITRVSDQLSDGLIFGHLFQANEKFSTF